MCSSCTLLMVVFLTMSLFSTAAWIAAVFTMFCRFAPEKPVDLEAILSMSTLSSYLILAR